MKPASFRIIIVNTRSGEHLHWNVGTRLSESEVVRELGRTAQRFFSFSKEIKRKVVCLGREKWYYLFIE